MMAMATKAFQAAIKKAGYSPKSSKFRGDFSTGRGRGVWEVKYFDRLRGKCKFMQITSIKTFRFLAALGQAFIIWPRWRGEWLALAMAGRV